MQYLLYFIAAVTSLIGIVGGAYFGDINLASNGLLAAVLCAAFGRIVHLLSRIEAHLKLGQITARMREERRIADALYPPPVKIQARPDSVAGRMRAMVEDIRS